MNTPTEGAQSLRRALQLLRMLAANPGEGVKLSTLIDESGLTRSTTHRLLTCLVEEHFAERDNTTHRYRLGIDSMQLGIASTQGAPLVGAYRPLMKKLARMSGDTVFLVIRQGDYSLCIHREEGHYPVKVFTTDIGERRLLGIGAGGLALLASLSDADIADVLERNAAGYAETGFTPAALKASVKKTRQLGYSEITDTITEGVSGVGRAFQATRLTAAALSFGAITVRLPPARRKELALMLATQLQELQVAYPN